MCNIFDGVKFVFGLIIECFDIFEKVDWGEWLVFFVELEVLVEIS